MGWVGLGWIGLAKQVYNGKSWASCMWIWVAFFFELELYSWDVIDCICMNLCECLRLGETLWAIKKIISKWRWRLGLFSLSNI